MMIRLLFIAVITVSVLRVSDAGGVRNAPNRHVMTKQKAASTRTSLQHVGVNSSARLTWVVVDTMEDAYSMLSNRVDPLFYHPASGYVGMVHQGKASYAAGSGELWYNTSPDGVGGWSRIAQLNNPFVPPDSRYPSSWVAGTDESYGALFTVSAPQVTPDSFGWIMYGADILNSGAPWQALDQGGPFWSNTRLTGRFPSYSDSYFAWAASNDPYVPNASNSAVHVWGTFDYGIIHETDVWDLSLFQTRGLDIGLCYRNDVLYLGAYATFAGDPDEVYNVFYSKSTDDGLTWSTPSGPFLGVGDWRDLPAIASSGYDDWEANLSFDMLVDSDGRVHFFGVLEDTDDPDAGLAVVEIYETSSGWDSKFVSVDLVASTLTNYGAVDQMGFHVGTATTPDGTGMVALWLSAPFPGDTLPDIWAASRDISSNLWSDPVNLSNTPDYAELLLQVAPILRDSPDGYLVHIARCYEQGIDTYPPIDVNPAEIFVATVPVPTGIIGNTDSGTGLPLMYRLAQNYPNPFNPTTTFEFSLPHSLFATLSVYNLLGERVAVVVEEHLSAGTHTVQWDATIQPSGVYFYRLRAGEYVETRKLVLLR